MDFFLVIVKDMNDSELKKGGESRRTSMRLAKSGGEDGKPNPKKRKSEEFMDEPAPKVRQRGF